MEGVRSWFTDVAPQFPQNCRSEFPSMKFASIVQQLMDLSVSASVIEAAWCPSFLDFLLSLLNDDSTTAKVKLTALVALVHLSKVPNKDYREQLLLPIALQLDSAFASMLDEKQHAAEELGTMLGRQHEYVVVLLMRGTNYSLTGRDLLQDLCSGNRSLFLQILFALLKVPAYELDLKVNALMCLYNVTLPNTYFSPQDFQKGSTKTSSGDGDESGSMSATAFLEHVDSLLQNCLSCNAMVTVTESLTTSFSKSFDPVLRAAKNGGESPTFAPEVLHTAFLYSSALGYWAKFFINLFTFSLQGRETTAWRQSLAMIARQFVVKVLLDGFLQNVGLLFSSFSGLKLQTLLGNVEAVATALALAVFGLSDTHMNLIRDAAITPSISLLTALSSFDTQASTILMTRVLQFHINMDTFALPKVVPGDGGHLPADTSPSEVMPSTELSTDLFRIVLIQCGRRGADDISLLYKLTTSCSSKLPLLAKQSFSFRTICDMLETFASDKKQLALATSTSEGSLDASGGGGDLSDDELDEMTAQLDQDIQTLEKAINDTEASRDVLEHLAAGEDAAVPPSDPSSPYQKLDTTATADDGDTLGKKEKKKHHKKGKHHHKKKKVLKEESIHPKEFLCMWSGALMKNPVTLPSGNHYELDVLERIQEDMGHVDPVSMEPYHHDPDINIPLQRKIQRYLLELAVLGVQV